MVLEIALEGHSMAIGRITDRCQKGARIVPDVHWMGNRRAVEIAFDRYLIGIRSALEVQWKGNRRVVEVYQKCIR